MLMAEADQLLIVHDVNWLYSTNHLNRCKKRTGRKYSSTSACPKLMAFCLYNFIII